MQKTILSDVPSDTEILNALNDTVGKFNVTLNKNYSGGSWKVCVEYQFEFEGKKVLVRSGGADVRDVLQRMVVDMAKERLTK